MSKHSENALRCAFFYTLKLHMFLKFLAYGIMQNFLQLHEMPPLHEKPPPHLAKRQLRKSKFTNIAKSLSDNCYSTFGENVAV